MRDLNNILFDVWLENDCIYTPAEKDVTERMLAIVNKHLDTDIKEDFCYLLAEYHDCIVNKGFQSGLEIGYQMIEKILRS